MEMDLLTFTGIDFNDVRVVMLDGEPWYVASDVTRELGIKSGRSAVNYYVYSEDMKILHEKDCLTASRPTLDIPNRGLKIVNESGMYALLFSVPVKTKSTDPEVNERIRRAHAFKSLVLHEILPAIRKNQTYTVRPMRKWTEIPPAERELYKNEALDVLRRQYDDAEEILEYAFFGSDIATSIGSMTIEQFAKSLSGAYSIGQNKLFALMRKMGYLMSDRLKSSKWNSPKQSEIKAGRMTVGILLNDKTSYTRTFVTMEGLKYYLTKIDAYLESRKGPDHRPSLLKMVDDSDKLIWNLFPEARPDRDYDGFYQLKPTGLYHARLNGLKQGYYLFGISGTSAKSTKLA